MMHNSMTKLQAPKGDDVRIDSAGPNEWHSKWSFLITILWQKGFKIQIKSNEFVCPGTKLVFRLVEI